MPEFGLHKLSLFLWDSIWLGLFRTKQQKSRQARQKVLIIRLDAIGDFVLWLDAARALRECYPRKQFDVTLLANAVWAPLAKDLGIFDSVWSLDRKKFIWNPFYRLKQFLLVRRQYFELVVHPVTSREFSFGDSLVRASGALSRIGSQGDIVNSSPFSKKISDSWYTKLLIAEQGEMPELQRHDEFIRDLGCAEFKSSVPSFTFQYDLPAGFVHQKFYVVVPGAGAQYRQWPLENFAQIARSVYDLTGLTAVVCGAKSESSLGDRLIDIQPGLFKNWVGKTSLRELVAIINAAEFVLSNETSAIHIAALLNVPSVCILGGGHFGRFLPYEVDNKKVKNVPLPVYVAMDCFHCNWQCRFNVPKGRPAPCVENVKVEAALKTIEQVLMRLE